MDKMKIVLAGIFSWKIVHPDDRKVGQGNVCTSSQTDKGAL